MSSNKFKLRFQDCWDESFGEQFLEKVQKHINQGYMTRVCFMYSPEEGRSYSILFYDFETDKILFSISDPKIKRRIKQNGPTKYWVTGILGKYDKFLEIVEEFDEGRTYTAKAKIPISSTQRDEEYQKLLSNSRKFLMDMLDMLKTGYQPLVNCTVLKKGKNIYYKFSHPKSEHYAIASEIKYDDYDALENITSWASERENFIVRCYFEYEDTLSNEGLSLINLKFIQN